MSLVDKIDKRVLVIGGGDQSLYDPDYFYVIGDHNTSNYGKGKKWNNNLFWNNLQKNLTLKKFDAVIFDNGSESWLPEDAVFNKIINLIISLLNDNGIILAIGLFKNNNKHDKEHRIHTALYLNTNLNTVGYFIIENTVYNIYSKVKNIESTIITDMKNIYINTAQLREKISFWTSKTDKTDTTKHYFYEKKNCVKEKDQIEFIKKRILKINNKN